MSHIVLGIPKVYKTNLSNEAVELKKRQEVRTGSVSVTSKGL